MTDTRSLIEGGREGWKALARCQGMCVIREEEEEEEVSLTAYNKCQKVGKRTGLGKSARPLPVQVGCGVIRWCVTVCFTGSVL